MKIEFTEKQLELLYRIVLAQQLCVEVWLSDEEDIKEIKYLRNELRKLKVLDNKIQQALGIISKKRMEKKRKNGDVLTKEMIDNARRILLENNRKVKGE